MSPKIYLPMAQVGPAGGGTGGNVDARRGVMLPEGHVEPGDLETLQVGWWYDYVCTPAHLVDKRYIPMSFGGGADLPGLARDYAGRLLALNEPEFAEQGDCRPAEAARRVRALQAAYPKAQLIVAGCSHWGTEWLTEFVGALGDFRPAGYHMHAYVDRGVGLDFLAGWWFANVRRLCQGEIWLSEFADVTGGSQARALLETVKAAGWITRYAWFANRMTPGVDWYVAPGWCDASLVGPDGRLSELGKLYTGG